ncbi:TatD family hydrolase [Ferviditalea candida]|uniref:TatD family hydrolase n=1 Tax=Ferviditalea candida TaxID=3108399 RepID=A0ABU5ZJE7_9BACL|nr:TatD family hydrolase [Paenibacillaceae bacterium T2]
METDGPWPFEGPFQGMGTHPQMVRRVVEEIAGIKSLSVDETAKAVTRNTAEFYRL